MKLVVYIARVYWINIFTFMLFALPYFYVMLFALQGIFRCYIVVY